MGLYHPNSKLSKVNLPHYESLATKELSKLHAEIQNYLNPSSKRVDGRCSIF